jgi:hypothetical protein
LYPFEDTLLGVISSDEIVVAAIERGLDLHDDKLEDDANWVHHQQAQPVSLSTALLDDMFSNIFDEATALLQRHVAHHERKAIPHRLRHFMKLLRTQAGPQQLWSLLGVNTLCKVVSVLRAARRGWRRGQPPSTIGYGCKTARAIDAFLAVETLNWNRCRLKKLRRRARRVAAIKARKRELGHEGKQDDGSVASTEKRGLRESRELKEQNQNKDREHGNLGHTAAHTAAGKSAGQRSVEVVIERLRNLHLDVDPAELREAFGKLDIQGGAE